MPVLTGSQCTTIPPEAVAGASFVQESGPEVLALKHGTFVRMEAALSDHAVVASSSSGIMPSDLQAGRRRPERYLVVHPFNPPHLIPLVEVVGGQETSSEVVDWAMGFYAQLGKKPIRLRKEVPGHLVNRLQAALWREAVHAVVDGVADVADIDAGVAYGPGLRWAVTGPLQTFHLGGGEGGIRHFLDHLGPPVEGWWRDLGHPSLTPDVRAKLIEGVTAAVADRSVADLARERDTLLVAVLQALVAARSGA